MILTGVVSIELYCRIVKGRIFDPVNSFMFQKVEFDRPGERSPEQDCCC